MAPLSRRELLELTAAGAALVAVGCGDDDGGGGDDDVADAPVGGGSDAPAGADGGGGGMDATPQCLETEDNILGPFYKEGAPMQSQLASADEPGVRLTVSGFVMATTCGVLADALLDVWQADAEGAYDNAGFNLRGKLVSAADGSYSFSTIIPGNYLNGAQYRPAHIHVTVTSPGHVALTTQLYFEGDPYNEIDPFIRESLIMALEDAPDGAKTARFDFVLQPA